MVAVSEGDSQALADLFDRHHRLLFNFFLKWLANREASEDLVQEVFFRVLKYGHSYRNHIPFKYWFFRIAHNVGKDYGRKHAVESAELHGDWVASAVDPEAVLASRGKIASLARALDRLTIEKRELLILSRFHNLKYKHLAELLECSVATVKVRVHRALKELRDHFKQIHEEPAP